MFGPLPKRYRWAVAGVVLGACLVMGLWMGANPAVPVLVSVGVALGLVAGAPLAWLTVHESRRDAVTPLRAEHRRS